MSDPQDREFSHADAANNRRASSASNATSSEVTERTGLLQNQPSSNTDSVAIEVHEPIPYQPKLSQNGAIVVAIGKAVAQYPTLAKKLLDASQVPLELAGGLTVASIANMLYPMMMPKNEQPSTEQNTGLIALKIGLVSLAAGTTFAGISLGLRKIRRTDINSVIQNLSTRETSWLQRILNSNRDLQYYFSNAQALKNALLQFSNAFKNALALFVAGGILFTGYNLALATRPEKSTLNNDLEFPNTREEQLAVETMYAGGTMLALGFVNTICSFLSDDVIKMVNWKALLSFFAGLTAANTADIYGFEAFAMISAIAAAAMVNFGLNYSTIMTPTIGYLPLNDENLALDVAEEELAQETAGQSTLASDGTRSRSSSRASQSSIYQPVDAGNRTADTAAASEATSEALPSTPTL